MAWLTKLAQLRDYHRSRYHAFVVDSESDRQACLQLLDQVRGEELGRVYGNSALDSAAFSGAQVTDRLLACRDVRTGEIVGCLRSTPAEQVAHLTACKREYQLDQIPRSLLERTEIATRLAVRKEYRQGVASLALVEKTYIEGLRRGSSLMLLSCEPGLVALYTRLGFHPLGRVHAGANCGFRMTMVGVHHDREHFEELRSPMAKLLRKHGGEPDEDALHWWAQYQRHHSAADAGLRPYSPTGPAIHDGLTAGMSPKGVKALLRNSYLVDCVPGHPIIAEGDGGRALFIVERGRVELDSGGCALASFTAGEIFGELAATLSTPQTVNVHAATPDTRVLVLSQHALQRISGAADRAALWNNLARVLARHAMATIARSSSPGRELVPSVS